MSAATKRRKVKKDKVGKEGWRIVGPDGKVLRESGYSEGAVLSMAQNLIQTYDEPTALVVQLKPLFGEPDVFYRVVLDEDGAVTTWRQ